MKKIFFITGLLFLTIACSKPKQNFIQGKIERESIGLVSKIPGKIKEIKVAEGDLIKKGDTLLILDIPEVNAKRNQAEGAVLSAKAQYDMSVRGATSNQIKQLEAKKQALKEQYDFAQKSITRLSNMIKDSLVSQQVYDEAFAKYQGTQAQYLAVQAEIADVKNGLRIEQQNMALGQQDRAIGALEEVSIADAERFIIAPQDMTIESITLRVGELALPGYTLISGSIADSTYFRFTLVESQLSKVENGQEVTVKITYNNKEFKGKVTMVKVLGAYANIATAYPDYELQESLFEVKVQPNDIKQAQGLFAKATAILEL